MSTITVNPVNLMCQQQHRTLILLTWVSLHQIFAIVAGIATVSGNAITQGNMTDVDGSHFNYQLTFAWAQPQPQTYHYHDVWYIRLMQMVHTPTTLDNSRPATQELASRTNHQ